MKAVIFDAPGQVRLFEKAEPVMQPDEVLLKINLVGLCGTDLNIYKGNMPLVSYPRIPGHEVSGVILEKGREVAEYIKIGKAVTINPYSNCGKCMACRSGKINTCRYNQTMGVQRDGAMVQYLSVPHQKIIQSDILNSTELALVEPLSVGYHAANRARIVAGECVVVIGCGMIGIGAVLAALRKKAIVIAIDIDDQKLALMKSLGAQYVINSSRVDAITAIMEITGGEGVNASIEAVGVSATYRLALEAAGFTGRVVYIGYANEEISFDTTRIVKKELDIMGSRNALMEFTDVIEMLEEKQFEADKLISGIYPMHEIGEAFRFWKNNPHEVIKLLTMIDE